ncbi:MAG: APC family permease [Mycobacterium sp.]
MSETLNSSAATTELVDEAADDFCVDCGYQPELKRSLGSFQVFAISFASMSVAIGIFSTYDDMLRGSGPVGIWLWPIAMVGQLLIALVYAQFAARIPLTGSSYQWGSRLANPKIGFIYGWLSVCGGAITVAAIDSALASTAFMPLFGIPDNEGTARLITLSALAIQVVLAIGSTRIMSLINSAAVGLEFVIVIALGIALVVAVVVTGTASTSNLTSRGIAEHATNYFGIGGGLMVAMLMGMTTLQGFEVGANMAEEAKAPFRSVPRAIVGSVIASGTLGMLFLIALTVSIKDIPKVSASQSSVALVIHEQLGSVVERVLLVGIIFAFFGGGLVVIVTCARIVYAMSRDQRFPGYRLMRRVNPRTQTPIPATILYFALGVILLVVLPGQALLQLIQAGTLNETLLYALTVILYLAVRKRLARREGAFDLGRFELPIAVSALVWTGLVVFFVMAPSDSLSPAFVIVGLVLAGGVYLAYMWFARREVLDNEPGDDIFEIDTEVAK